MSAEDTLSLGDHPKFLCGVAVSVYQNSGDQGSPHMAVLLLQSQLTPPFGNFDPPLYFLACHTFPKPTT